MDDLTSQPATLGNLNQLEHRFDQKMDAMEHRIDQRMEAMDQKMDGMEQRIVDKLTEHMRDMQTELLRGFSDFSRSSDIRLRKIEADAGNLNEASTRRLAALEMQMQEVRAKILLDPRALAMLWRRRAQRAR